MSNLSLEKINRGLYKQELEVQKKYPGINGQINSENFTNFFIFNENINLNQTSSYSLYEINSFNDNEQKPDIYTPYGKISGNVYDFNNKINNNNITEKNIIRYYDINIYTDLDTFSFDEKKNAQKKSKKNSKNR